MNNKSKTILMVAFEFPPSNGASVPRIESFYRYLKQWGWRVVVLTANAKAYDKLNPAYRDEPEDLIYRAFALDAPRHLSFKGKYFAATSVPDRWGATWIPAALVKARHLLKKYQPDVIWSSSPIPSSHYIASKIAKWSGAPWLADYRDPFHYMNGSAGKYLDKIHQAIDSKALRQAQHLTFATQQVRDLYQQRYGDTVANKNTVIENGYDEANFTKLAELTDKSTPFADDKFSIYYSGVLYPNGRDPRPIFNALGQLKRAGKIDQTKFELIFQGAGDGNEFKAELEQHDISDLVTFIAPVPFIKALNNMVHADALLLIQDTRFNKQIPGKVYEYLRTYKPLLVKADPVGATAQLVEGFEGVYTGMTEQELCLCLTNVLASASRFEKRELSSYNREGKARVLDDVLVALIS